MDPDHARESTADTGGDITGDIAGDTDDDLDGYDKPSELESALLTLSLFGGLVLFGLGCLVMW